MKKWSLAHICAYLSLAISVTLLVLWSCNVGGFTVVNLDSFVGVIVALLAIIVAFVVGWQIYNSIEIKDKIEGLSTLEVRIKEQEKALKQELLKSEHRLSTIYGIEARKDECYIDAFRYIIISINASMQLEMPMNIERCLTDLEKTCDLITNGDTYSPNLYKEICKYNDSIRSLSNYSFIQKRYEKIYNDFISRIKVDEQ